MARSNESPMDFQWQQADLDGSSSPSRTFFPAIYASDSRSARIPSTPSTNPQFQFRNSSFATPQRPFDLDLSSGAENQSSPANGDSEDTPDPSPRDVLPKISAAKLQFRSERQQPAPGIFGRYGMSGRGEIQRKSHSDIMVRRIHKRKRREADRDIRITRRRPMEDSGSEGEDRARPSRNEDHQRRSQGVHEIGFIPTFFSYLETHPNLPHVLSYYAQFLLNFFLVSVVIYMIYAFWSTIRSDVNEKSKEAASEILVEMAMCARDFRENKCDNQEARVPAMESICNSWEKCMQRDPTMVGRAKVSAHTFAEIINNFFQPISAKAMVIKTRCLAVNNFTMYLFRQKTHPQSSPTHPPYPQYPPTAHSQTPYAGDEHQFSTPYQHPMGLPNLDYRTNGAGKHSPRKRLDCR
ncbi:MAG: hypothetical protein Q9216_004250 [Gyalolechia sp. 2 TL-2023]